jgi:hypothetical protein
VNLNLLHASLRIKSTVAITDHLVAIVGLEWVVFSYCKKIMLRWSNGTFPILSHCYVAPMAHLIRTLTSNSNLTFMQLVMFQNKKKLPSKTQLHKSNIINYICRPSTCIFQADIWKILGSVQIISGMEISLLKCFCY